MSEETYPTVWAYEQACAALATCKAELARQRRDCAWSLNERDSALDAMRDSDEENKRLRVALAVLLTDIEDFGEPRRHKDAMTHARAVLDAPFLKAERLLYDLWVSDGLKGTEEEPSS